MSYYNDLKNTDLVAFVGKVGVGVLAKALEKVFVETDLSASDLAKSLHLKSRCLMAWLDCVKSTELAKIPLTSNVTDTVTTDHVIAFQKNTAIINKREITKFSRKSETVSSLTDYSLPELAAQVLALPAFEDEIGSETSFQSIPELDKVVKSLVKRHLEFLETAQQLKLNKNEGATVCQDCGEHIKVSETGANLCICYKMFKSNSVHVTKNDNGGLTVHFGKNWDAENIAMFSQALKNRLK